MLFKYGPRACRAGLEIRILEPEVISVKIARKLLLFFFFVHKFIWEPGAFYLPASANLLFCSCYFKACPGAYLIWNIFQDYQWFWTISQGQNLKWKNGFTLFVECHAKQCCRILNIFHTYVSLKQRENAVLRGNCTPNPNQKLACFVLYLTIINTFQKNNICMECLRNSKIALKFK